MSKGTADPEFMTPGEVADLMRVDPKTVTRWANAGKIPGTFTKGGHRRFLRETIMKILRDPPLPGKPCWACGHIPPPCDETKGAESDG